MIRMFTLPSFRQRRNCVRSRFAPHCRLRLSLQTLEDRSVPATINWTGGPDGNGTVWSDPNNWDMLQVPGNEDSAVIGATGTSPTIAIGSVSVASINASNRNLSITGTLNTPNDVFKTCNVDFNGGTLIAAKSDWTYGTIITGTTTFVNTGVLNLFGSTANIAVENSGTVSAGGIKSPFPPLVGPNSIGSIANSGTLNVGYTTNIGSITTSAGSTIKLTNPTFGQAVLNAFGFVNHGSIIMNVSKYNTDTMQLNISSGTMVNASDGSIIVPTSEGGAASFNFASFDNQGLFEVNPAAAFITSTGNVSIGAGGKLDNHGTMNVNFNSTMSLGTGAVFTNSGNITVAWSQTLRASLTNAASGTLTGNGTITGNVSGPGTMKIGYDAMSGTGRLTVNGNVDLGGPLVVDLPVYNFDGAGLNVNGTVTLGGSLSFNVVGWALPGYTDSIINNDGTDAVNGTFAGLPQLSNFQVGSQWFQINYKGGTGNDVTLTCLPPRVQSVVVNDGDAQRSRVTSVKVAFDNVVFPNPPASAFELKRQSDNLLVALTASVANTSTQTTVTLTFSGALSQSGSLADGRYTLTAIASKINGGNFDGNGDGTPGDNYILASSGMLGIFRLFGDADGNGTIAAADFNAFRLAYGTTGSSIFDFDGDIQVTAADFDQFRLRYGVSI